MAKTDRAFRALSRAQPEVIAEMLRVLAPHSLPPNAQFALDDLAPTQVDALPPALDADCIARVGDDEIRHVEFQGYRDTGFSERCVWYHVGTALRYRGKRRVRTIALWLMPLPKGQTRNVMRAGDISVRVKTIVLPHIPAAKLLANPKTVCLAAGANPGSWSDQDLCSRVANGLRNYQATWSERHIAVVAALMQGRYDAMVTAMEHAQLEPVIIEDLVKYGEDLGFERGISQGLSQGLSQGITQVHEDIMAERLGRPLTAGERATLVARMATTSLKMLLHADVAALEAWLADPSAK